MDRAHRQRITGIRHFWSDSVRNGDGGRLLRVHGRFGMCFAADRDADRRAFNARFGTSLLTEAEARDQLQRRKAAVPPGYRDYAPIDFGGGLTVGQAAVTDSGTGRWDFFNGSIVGPLVRGRRVLDLGSNNGSLPLMMLRAGAERVTAVEFTPQIADFARLNGEILAWRDMRPYNFDEKTGDMRLFLTEDLGTFDVVTAFCSLYYLPEEDMARIIAKAAAMGATLVLQANESIDNLPARAGVLARLMRENGYDGVGLHEYPGFGRPILVGEPVPVAAAAPAVMAI